MTPSHRIAAHSLATALAAVAYFGLDELPQSAAALVAAPALAKADRVAAPASGPIAASFALFDDDAVAVRYPAGVVTVVLRSPAP